MTYSTLQPSERRLLALYDCQCVMALPAVSGFLSLITRELATSDTIEVGEKLMNIYHITPKGELEARRLQRRVL